ncbi:tyrosine-type recombinase/integrase [Streptomyces sp. NPDC006854]|uniref:tyrosine-type recombinase/integrase n=1 Tax=Streptomyces sp. NPDC006854 TaxID=3155115 RepID=UPI0033D98997
MTVDPLQLIVNPAAKAARTRTVGDRLEVLEALIAAPSFDPLFREDVIRVPTDHPVYGWHCRVAGCQRCRDTWRDYCNAHNKEWSAVQRAGGTIVDFFSNTQPLAARGGYNLGSCLICLHAPAYSADGLCYLHANHLGQWRSWRLGNNLPGDLDIYVAEKDPYPDFGQCKVPVCPGGAVHWIGLCSHHHVRYSKQGRPGGAEKIRKWGKRPKDLPLSSGELTYTDKAAFLRWCRQQEPVGRTDGTLSLLGMRPLVKAEFKWGVHHHAAAPEEGARWPLNVVQRVAAECRRQNVDSLADVDIDKLPHHGQKIAQKMLQHLRLVYFTREDTKQAGYIEFDHYGIRLTNHGSYFDMSYIPQRWLRDLLWDWMDHRLHTDPPRSFSPFGRTRRGCVELGSYLEVQTPGGGHDPTLLTREHMLDFVKDQRYRAEHGLQPLGCHHPALHRGKRKIPPVSKAQVTRTFDGARVVLRGAMDSGEAERLGLGREFIVALPTGGNYKSRPRRPFSDEVERALANEVNLRALDAMDFEDRGLRDVWETIVVTGRRASEALELRLNCIGRIRKVPIFWHDQTKVGNLEEGIRISERLYQRIKDRQSKTEDRFVQKHGRLPSEEERKILALFPRRTTNRNCTKSVSYNWFKQLFTDWVQGLDVEHSVPHQARHTVATNLLKNGANLTHVKRYLGHVSEAMAEHYVHLANTDPLLDQALQAVWVAGPGAAEPGLVLSDGEPMSREEAEALAIDLTRKSTPAEGGFCTFQAVVNGHACPWNLDCHNCDKFVMSGADLVYWHRKRDQWRTLAEQATDSKTADFLHDYFEPTARAIAGLEKALEAVGLLDEALAIDLRRPQDYFGRVWATAFRAEELARRADLGDIDINDEAGLTGDDPDDELEDIA